MGLCSLGTGTVSMPVHGDTGLQVYLLARNSKNTSRKYLGEKEKKRENIYLSDSNLWDSLAQNLFA